MTKCSMVSFIQETATTHCVSQPAPRKDETNTLLRWHQHRDPVEPTTDVSTQKVWSFDWGAEKFL